MCHVLSPSYCSHCTSASAATAIGDTPCHPLLLVGAVALWRQDNLYEHIKTQMIVYTIIWTFFGPSVVIVPLEKEKKLA